jgi:CRISPR-associated protein Cas1
VVRGFEGESARRYFAALPNLIRSDQRAAFTPDGRSRRPPRDRMNALLSFLYSMLMNDCRTALESVGLDPQLGYLHTIRPGRAALALDLMEEFRSILADRLALTLVNRKQLQASDFEERPGGAVQMHDAARKALIIAYQERKQELTSHPLLDQKLAIGLLPQIQARLLARVIRGEAEDYLPYLER